MQKIHVLALAAITALAFPSLASATTVVTIAGDPNAAISNFQNPGNTATSPYTITTSDNGTQVVVALTTTDLGALDFANLYFETVASDVSMGSNLGFEASGSAVNDAFFPDTGQKFSTEIVVRGRSQDVIDAAGADVQTMIEAIRRRRVTLENNSAEA